MILLKFEERRRVKIFMKEKEEEKKKAIRINK